MVLAPWAVDLRAHLGSQNPKAILDIMVRDALDETGENFLSDGCFITLNSRDVRAKGCSMLSAQQLVCFASLATKMWS